mmetsp:Transcript_40350/g.92291  ORF Transcript_40350/g.92291 Transcript_40350/m.92291 type:complete len:540 (+) Transcript_40350:18-1637(+)
MGGVMPCHDRHRVPLGAAADVQLSQFASSEWFQKYRDPSLDAAEALLWSPKFRGLLENADCAPSSLKLVVRRGVPDELKGEVWLRASGASVHLRQAPGFFDESVLRAFGERAPTTFVNTPLCAPEGWLQEYLEQEPGAPSLCRFVNFVDVLVPDGQHALQRILWIVNQSYSFVEMCPVLPPLLTVLLCFLDEPQTFSVLHCMLEQARSRVKQGEDRWYLPYNQAQLDKYTTAAMTVARNHIAALLSHLERIGFDTRSWFYGRVLGDGLSRLLPLCQWTRVMSAMISEGCKVFMRFGLALLKVNSEAIRKCSTAAEVENILSSKAFDIDRLTKVAFGFQIRSSNPKAMQGGEVHDSLAGAVPLFCRPRLSEPSEALHSDAHWESLWQRLPADLRILDPKLVFTSRTDGCSLSRLLKAGESFRSNPAMLCVQTRTQEVLGYFLCSGLYFTGSAYAQPDRSDGSFVFHFDGDLNLTVSPFTGANDMTFLADRDALVVGGPQPAMRLDSDLNWGFSDACPSYGSPAVCGGRFQIAFVELFALG